MRSAISVILIGLYSISIWSVPAMAATDASKVVDKPDETKVKKNPKELRKKLFSRYEKMGMGFVKSLWLKNDGSEADEKRSEKSNVLEYKLREKTIQRSIALLKKTKSKPLQANLYRRLAKLYEKQADTVSRLVNVKNKIKVRDKHIHEAIDTYHTLKNKFWKLTAKDEVYFFLGENYGKINNIKSAEQNYKMLVKDYPQSIYVPDALLSLGNIDFDRKQFTAAREKFAAILKNPSKVLHAYAHYKMAWCYLNQAMDESAKNAMIKAIHTSRQNAKIEGLKQISVVEEALNDLVLFYAESGEPKKAKEFFEKIVSREEAKEYRYRLVKQYYEYSKHEAANFVAQQLLADTPPKKRVSRLLLVSLSVAEQTKKRNLSLKMAAKLSDWIIELQAGKHKDLDQDELKADIEESEDTLRRYSQKIHFEAQKKAQVAQLWQEARKAYEIYLRTFKSSEERPEILFRYGALLFHRKSYVNAYNALDELVKSVNKEHKRHFEAMKLRIDSIEQANKGKVKIAENELIRTYDELVAAYPDDKVSPVAMFKAATVAEKVEGPKKSAIRYRNFVEKYGEHDLVQDAMSKSVAILAKAEQWQDLKEETEKLLTLKPAKNRDNKFMMKIASAHETAALKIVEKMEENKQFAEAAQGYGVFAEKYPDSNLTPTALVKRAKLLESNLMQLNEAVIVWEKLHRDYPNVKESRLVELEMARLFEIMQKPEKAVNLYLQFSTKGSSKEHFQAITNAALILESMAGWLHAAEVYETLARELAKAKQQNESRLASESSCRNYVLAVKSERQAIDKLLYCAQKMAAATKGKAKIFWLTRVAWSQEKLDQPEHAMNTWQKIAQFRGVSDPESQAYVSFATLKQLVKNYKQYEKIQFKKSNENPEANLQRKSNGLAKVEAMAEQVITNGTTAQIIEARTIIKDAYQNFALTLRTSAIPSGLGEADAKVLRDTFETAALEMDKKALALDALIQQSKLEYAKEEDKNSPTRKLAAQKEEKIAQSIPEPSNREVEESMNALAQTPDNKSALAKLLFYHYHEKNYAMARYILSKWKTAKGNISLPVSMADLQTDLSKKVDAIDPVFVELTN